MKKLIFLLFLLPLSVCFAEGPPSNERADIEKEKQELIDEMDKMEKLAGQLMTEKEMECKRAFGNTEFCECLTDNLPIGVSFRKYIVIMTSKKDELDYDKLSREEKEMVDWVSSTREKCVNKVFSKLPPN